MRPLNAMRTAAVAASLLMMAACGTGSDTRAISSPSQGAPGKTSAVPDSAATTGQAVCGPAPSGSVPQVTASLNLPPGTATAATKGTVVVRNDSSSPVQVSRPQRVLAVAVEDGSTISGGSSGSVGAEIVTVPPGRSIEIDAVIALNRCNQARIDPDSTIPSGRYSLVARVLVGDRGTVVTPPQTVEIET